MILQPDGILSQRQKYGLRDVPGGMRLARHAEGGRINEINMPADQFRESAVDGTHLDVVVAISYLGGQESAEPSMPGWSPRA